MSNKKINKNKLCHLCKKAEGEIPVHDSNNKEILICEDCDRNLFNADALAKQLIREIDIQIRHHKEERNTPAINSLKYLKSLLT